MTVALIITMFLCSAVALLGFLPQDIVGTSIFQYYHPDDLPQLLDIYKKGEFGFFWTSIQTYSYTRGGGGVYVFDYCTFQARGWWVFFPNICQISWVFCLEVGLTGITADLSCKFPEGRAKTDGDGKFYTEPKNWRLAS